MFFQVVRVLGLRSHGRITKTVWTEADDWVTALFLPIYITRNFPWEQPNPQLIPHALISTVCNISHGMQSLQNKESWQPQKEKAASTRACCAEPGAQLPITSHRHKPLLPPKHQCPSGSCLHTAEKRISSIPSALGTQQWTQSSPELTDGESPCRVFWYLLWSSLPVQELTSLSMVSYDPIQFPTATSAARQWTVQASASLRQRSSCFYLLLRSLLHSTPSEGTLLHDIGV